MVSAAVKTAVRRHRRRRRDVIADVNFERGIASSRRNLTALRRGAAELLLRGNHLLDAPLVVRGRHDAAGCRRRHGGQRRLPLEGQQPEAVAHALEHFLHVFAFNLELLPLLPLTRMRTAVAVEIFLERFDALLVLLQLLAEVVVLSAAVTSRV